MTSMWTVALAIAAAQSALPLPEPSAPDAEPLIIIPSTIEDFDPGFVEPPHAVSRGLSPPPEPGTASSEFDRVRRKYEAEIRRIEAIIARTKAVVRDAGGR